MEKFLSNSNYLTILDNLSDGVFVTDLTRKILYWNKAAREITGYSSSDTLGKHCWEGVLSHTDKNGVKICETGSCPLLQAINNERQHEIEAFLLHKKGQRIPVFIRTIPLRNTKSKLIGAVEIFSDNSMRVAVRQKMEELTKMAMLDATTGIGTRKFIEINVNAVLDEAKRYGWQFGVIFADIDYFKKVNDTFGHDVGDMVLKMVARTLERNIRSFDIIGRWGGDEFLGLLLNIKENQLSNIAEKLRLLVSESSLNTGDARISVTISIGATMVTKKDTLDNLIKRVDSLMYRSKSKGRNLVSIDTIKTK